MRTLLHPCRLAALSVSLALAPLAAQTTTAATAANRFIPENSTFVVRIASPAKWREQFANTQVAKLMQGSTLAPLLEQASMAFDMGLDELRSSGEVDAELIESMLTEWQGDIVLSLQFDMAKLMESVQDGMPPPITGVLALTSEGGFDLAKLGAEIERMAEREEAGNMRDLVVGDLTLRRSDNGGQGPDATLPAMIDGALVMVIGSDIEKDAGRLLAADHRYAGAVGSGPLFMHMDLQAAIAAIIDTAAANAPPQAEEMMREMFRTMGFSSLTSMTMLIDADGQHVAGEFSVAMNERDRGMFAMYGSGASSPKLLRSVPANAESFSVSMMSLGKLFDTISEVWSGLGDEAPMSLEDVLQGFADATKVRLKEDLIDHLGDELLVVQDPAAMSEIDLESAEDDPLAMLGGSVIGISLKNGRAFGESLETAMRSRGMHAGRKTEEYGTTKVHRLKLGGLVEVEYVITDDLLLLGVGSSEGTHRVLRSVLDTRAAGETELPEAVRALAATMPAGWNGISANKVTPLMKLMGTAMVASGQMGEEAEMAQQVLNGLADDMTRLGISTIGSANYADAKGITVRWRW